MYKRTDVNYIYDGSFEGLLCCVFHSFTHKELPQGVYTFDDDIISFYHSIEVNIDQAQVKRVTDGIYKKLGGNTFLLIRDCFLSDLATKELNIIAFLQYSFKHGVSSSDHLATDCVLMVNKSAQRARMEAHKLKGFVRFIQRGGVLVSEISPDCRVLSLIAYHFMDRYGGEQVMIMDKSHKELLLISGGKYRIMPYDNIIKNAPDVGEDQYEALFRCFYESVNITQRKNLRCQNNFLPKKYRGDMTEFGSRLEGALPGG